MSKHLRVLREAGMIDWPNWGRDHMPDWQRIRDRYEAKAAYRPRRASQVVARRA